MALVKLQLRDISMAFGGFVALSPVSLAVPAGRFISLIGPSGCGKSTLFNVIAGLLAPSAGQVLIDGQDHTGLIGRVGYMLQKDLLLPWRTVLDNIALGLEIRGMPRRAARAEALPLLRRYGLDGFEAKYPATLSGGMRQRAALLRTLLTDTDIILLDEPFGALDAQTRARMQDWLLQIWGDFGKTVLFVTHDVEEAVYLSDTVVVMGSRPGRVLETLDVPIPRPRLRAVQAMPEFLALKDVCLGLLHGAAEDTAPDHAAPNFAGTDWAA